MKSTRCSPVPQQIYGGCQAPLSSSAAFAHVSIGRQGLPCCPRGEASGREALGEAVPAAGGSPLPHPVFPVEKGPLSAADLAVLPSRSRERNACPAGTATKMGITAGGQGDRRRQTSPSADSEDTVPKEEVCQRLVGRRTGPSTQTMERRAFCLQRLLENTELQSFLFK